MSADLEPNFDENEIERLLQEIGGESTPPRQPTHVVGTAIAHVTPEDAHRAKVEFSTYDTVPGSRQSQVPVTEAAAIRRPARLGPLGTKETTRGELSPDKRVLGHNSPTQSPSPEQRGDACAGDTPASTETLLPLLNCRRLASTGIVPRKRWGHTLAASGEHLYMFGGVVVEGSKSESTNDFFSLNLSTLEWEPVFCSRGHVPARRSVHTLSSIEKDGVLVLFGGQGATNTLLGDLHVFSVQSQEWQDATGSVGGRNPSARMGHSAVVFKHKLYVYGGKCMRKVQEASTESANTHPKNLSPYVASGSVFMLDLHKMQWTELARAPKKAGDPSESPELSPQRSSRMPPKRWGHAACIANNVMYVHGGESLDGPLADLWGFNVQTKVWSVISEGIAQVPRQRHQLVAVGSSLLALGGSEASANAPFMTVWDAQQTESTQHWMPLKLYGSVLDSTQRNLGVAMHRGFVYVFGGSTQREPATNDVVRFLACDRIDTSKLGGPSIASSRMKALFDNKANADVILEIGGKRLGVHRSVLAMRAPQLWSAVQACAASADTPVVYSLEGNSRVKGLPKPLTADQLEALLLYLYCGHVAITENSKDDVLATLGDAAVAYGIDHLVEVLRTFDAGNCMRKSQNSPQNFDTKCSLVMHAGEKTLYDDLLRMVDQTPYPTAELSFEDPHTGKKSTKLVDSSLLINSSTFFRTALKPVVAEHREQNEYKGVCVKSRGAERSILVGPIRIPQPSIKPVLQYLYAASLDVMPEVALSVLMAAHTLELPVLQAVAESTVAKDEVSVSSACQMLSLALHYDAAHLREHALLTAAYGFGHVQNTEEYLALPQDAQDEVRRCASELMGKVPIQMPPQTLQKSESEYAKRSAKSFHA